jgi:hypothetical protein
LGGDCGRIEMNPGAERPGGGFGLRRPVNSIPKVETVNQRVE